MHREVREDPAALGDEAQPRRARSSGSRAVHPPSGRGRCCRRSPGGARRSPRGASSCRRRSAPAPPPPSRPARRGRCRAAPRSGRSRPAGRGARAAGSSAPPRGTPRAPPRRAAPRRAGRWPAPVRGRARGSGRTRPSPAGCRAPRARRPPHRRRPRAATAPNAAVSCSSWPLAGSSSSSTFGAVASARASSTTRAWPVGRRSARCGPSSTMPQALEQLVGDRVGLGGVRRRRPPAARSRARSAGRRARGAGTCGPGPRRARLNGASLVTSCAVDAHPARARRLEAADDVEQRGLARPRWGRSAR